MRTGSSDILSRGHRGRNRLDARLKNARKSRPCSFDLEGLECRTLLATIPAATASGTAVNLTNFNDVTTQGNANSPTVAVDPYDSQKLLAVWGVDLSTLSPVPFTNAVVEGAYSNNGGTSWVPLDVMDPVLDAATIDATPPTPYTQLTEPSVAFDGQGNVYVLVSQNTGVADGALTLSKFNFSNTSPIVTFRDEVVSRWLSTSDSVISPTLAVDAAPTPPPAGVPLDPHANNVYIAWASADIHPANPNVDLPYNPNRAELAVSSDGGRTFSGETIANVGPANGNIGPQQDSHPQLAINQNASGQITVGWDDFGTGSTASPKFDILNSPHRNP
jgi:hypothetical protein